MIPTETFLVLFAGGTMLSAALVHPRSVTLRWLRLAGLIALAMLGLEGFFLFRRDLPAGRGELMLFGLCAAAVLAQIGFVQVAWRKTQRLFAAIGFVATVVFGQWLLRSNLDPRAAQTIPAAIVAACALASATMGLAVMDMLLGHAYLNAAEMTMAPFRRLNALAAWALIARAALSCGGTFLLQSLRPVEMLFSVFGLYIITRWLVGLLVPITFVFMAHDCIRRRSTQSATGILYVAGVLVIIGEIIGLYLIGQTGMPL